MKTVVFGPDGRPVYSYEGTAHGGVPLDKEMEGLPVGDLRLVSGRIIHDPAEPDHGREKTAAIGTINALAEAARGRYITLGSGQAMVYSAKRREAAAWASARGGDLSKYPFLSARASRRGISADTVADEWAAKNSQADALMAAIEGVREAAIEAVTALPVNEDFRRDLRAIIDGLQWP